MSDLQNPNVFTTSAFSRRDNGEYPLSVRRWFASLLYSPVYLSPLERQFFPNHVLSAFISAADPEIWRMYVASNVFTWVAVVFASFRALSPNSFRRESSRRFSRARKMRSAKISKRNNSSFPRRMYILARAAWREAVDFWAMERAFSASRMQDS